MFDKQALALLEKALGGKAIIRKVPLPSEDAGSALEVRTRGGQHERFRLVPWKRRAEESEAKKAASWQSRYYRRMWVLRNASDGLRQELRESHACFVDLAGAVHLDLPYLIVDRSDLKPVPALSSTSRLIDPFADRSSQVVRVLLTHPVARGWGVRELAAAASVTPSTASRTARQLERQGLVSLRRAGRTARVVVSDPMTLVRRWANAYDWGRNTRHTFEPPGNGIQEILARIRNDLSDVSRWGLTLPTGAWLVAPELQWGAVHVYVELSGLDISEIAQRNGWRPADDGSFHVLFPYYKHSVWRDLRTDLPVPVVSDLQLVLDLWHYPGGREMANHLVQSRLRRVWEG
ncbi:MAG: helix-turn-helix domain-containing protein [Gemmatimonadetes bacterium]|nr:helix-turn-helix domain-containing protein [Gemmatimonadota bacterium]